jgi:hypothetical protein
METILTKTGSQGQDIEIAYDGTRLHVTLDGKSIGRGGVCKLSQPKGDITHYVSTTPAVGITSAEADMINTRTREISEADPRNQRAAICSKINAAMDTMSYHRNRYDGGTGSRFNDAKKARAEAEAAQAELDAFDVAHPELKAELDAERERESAEKIRRAMNA